MPEENNTPDNNNPDNGSGDGDSSTTPILDGTGDGEGGEGGGN